MKCYKLFIIVNFLTIKFPHCPLSIKKLTLVKTIKQVLIEQSFLNADINNSFWLISYKCTYVYLVCMDFKFAYIIPAWTNGIILKHSSNLIQVN